MAPTELKIGASTKDGEDWLRTTTPPGTDSDASRKNKNKIFRRRSWGGVPTGKDQATVSGTKFKYIDSKGDSADSDDDEDESEEEGEQEHPTKDKFGPGTGRDHRRRSLDYQHLAMYKTQIEADMVEIEQMAENFTKHDPVDLRHLDTSLPQPSPGSRAGAAPSPGGTTPPNQPAAAAGSSETTQGTVQLVAGEASKQEGQAQASKAAHLTSNNAQAQDAGPLDVFDELQVLKNNSQAGGARGPATGNDDDDASDDDDDDEEEEDGSGERAPRRQDHRRRSLDYQHVEQYKGRWSMDSDRSQPFEPELGPDGELLDDNMTPPLVVQYLPSGGGGAGAAQDPPFSVQRLDTSAMNPPLLVAKLEPGQTIVSPQSVRVGPGAKRSHLRKSLDYNQLDSCKTKFDNADSPSAGERAQGGGGGSDRRRSMDYAHLEAAKARLEEEKAEAEAAEEERVRILADAQPVMVKGKPLIPPAAAAGEKKEKKGIGKWFSKTFRGSEKGAAAKAP
eukprot:jgi/Mesen1/2816/ME000172S01970